MRVQAWRARSYVSQVTSLASRELCRALRAMLPIVDLDIFRSQPLDSPAVVAECTKVFV